MEKLTQAEALTEIARNLVSPNECDRNLEAANVVDGLFAIARSLDRVAKAIQNLGNADASTPMGGMEALGEIVHKGLDSIATSIGAGMTEVADALVSTEDS